MATMTATTTTTTTSFNISWVDSVANGQTN